MLKGEGVNDMLAFVVFVVDELFGGYHVQKLQDTTLFEVVGGCACEHGHGVDAHFQPGSLGHADTGTLDFEVFVSELHAVEAFHRDVGDGWVEVFAESDSLVAVVSKSRKRQETRLLWTPRCSCPL